MPDVAVTALDGVNESGEVHAAVETGWPKDLPEGALNGARSHYGRCVTYWSRDA